MQETEHTIVLGDAYTCLDRLKDNNQQVNSIITDVPYAVANKNTISFKNRKDMSRDFGAWDYFEGDSYFQSMNTFFSKASTIIKPAGNLLVFSRLENISHFISGYESVGFKHHATIIWHKTNPAPRVRKTGLLSSCEAILWAVKDFDKKQTSYTFHFGKQNEMHNFIETPICMGKERTAHETQKPRKVIDHLIKIYTNPGDVVLDPFAGSGTLSEAAAAYNRRSISIEKEQKYFEIMKKRLASIKNLTSVTEDQWFASNSESKFTQDVDSVVEV